MAYGMTPKCFKCTNHGYACNATRPCDSCITKQYECTDYDKNTGTATRYFTTTNMLPDPDLDNCDRCRSLKRNCGGFDDGPCYNCVEKYRKNNTREETTCSYTNIGNYTGKAYLLRAYKYELIDDNYVRSQIPFTWNNDMDRKILGNTFLQTGRYKNKLEDKAAKSNERDLKLQQLHSPDLDSDLDFDTSPTLPPYRRTTTRARKATRNVDLLGLDEDEFLDSNPSKVDETDTLHPTRDEAKTDSYDDDDLDDQDLHNLAMISLHFPTTTECITDTPVNDDLTYYGNLNSDDEDVDSDILHYAMAVTSQTSDHVPRNYAEAMKLPDAQQYHDATMAEFKQLKKLGVFEVVPLPPGKKAISTKLVYKKKFRPTGEIRKHKARCVARGFLQRKGIDYDESWAGTANSTAIRVLLALAVLLGWTRYQVDIATAFLYAYLKEETYAKPPPPIRLPPGHVWLLKRALYGLVQSPRAWFQTLKLQIIKLGFRQSLYESCIYIHTTRPIIISVVVDDLSIFTSSNEHAQWFKAELSRAFTTTDEEDDNIYSGMQINCTTDTTTLHQSAYASKILQRFDFNGLPPAKIPVKPSDRPTKNTDKVNLSLQKTYLEKYGSLNYLPTMTRPDLAYSMSRCGRYMANPSQDHMNALDNIYAYIKSTSQTSITYSKHEPTIQGYVDADWVGCLDTRRSTTGWVFTLAGGPVSWSSKRQNVVALSTTEAEYIAAAEAVKEALWLKRFINDLGLKEYTISTIPLHVDNKSAIALIKNPVDHQRTKHIDARHHFIRDVVEEGHVTVKWISGKDNVADMFTKPLPQATFEQFKNKLNIK
jgi:hypothetical protein